VAKRQSGTVSEWTGAAMFVRAAMMVCAMVGCRASGPPPAPKALAIPEARPSDFVMAATVFSPARLSGADLPRSLKPARYVIEADGVLRAATGSAADATTFPGQTRQLTPGEFDSLWRLLRESGLLDSNSPLRVPDPETLVRAPDRTTALIYVSYGGERRTLRVPLDRVGEGALATERVVDRLAEWAWVRGGRQ
jgi:hypothetical protein